MCFTSARRSRRLRTGRNSEAGVFFACWMSVDECMPLWSWTDGRGQTSAACVRALHMLKLGEVAGADAERRTLGRWSARRVVGLVGLRGLFLDGGAQSYRAAGQVWGQKPGWLGAHPCRTGGTTGGRLVGLVGFVGLFRAKRARRNCLRGSGLAGQAWGHIRAELGAHPAAAWWVRSVSGSCSGSLARGKPPWGRPWPWGHLTPGWGHKKCAPTFEKCAPKCAPNFLGWGWTGLDGCGQLRC